MRNPERARRVVRCVRDPEACDADGRLLRQCVEGALISRTQAASVEEELQERELAGRAAVAAELLVERGLLTPGQIVQLQGGPPAPTPVTISPAEAARPPGLAKLGRYHVVRQIARGGMAVVYEASDPDLNRRVALKVLKEGEASPRLIERLHREALAAARLRHPNIVTVHEVGSVRDPAGELTHFIAMDYIAGTTLAEALPQMATRDRLRVLECVARAVGYAHGRGVVHRDLKPPNVLLEPVSAVDATGLKWRVWLTDFGLAKVLDGEDLTRTGAVIGTPHYMAPEQVRGATKQMGPPTDVWALGVMLYEMLAGQTPFQGATALEVYEKIARSDPPPLRTAKSSAHADIETICLRALDKVASHRYATAAEFADDLRRFLNGEPIAARRTSWASRAVGKVRKNALAYGLGSAACAAAAVAVVVWLVGAERTRVEREATVEMMRKTAGLALDAELGLRRAGGAGTGRFLPELEAAYRGAVEKAPQLAEVEYLMGRMYRALMRNAEALECQDRALHKDPNYGPALYERAVLRSIEYGRTLRGAYESARALEKGPITGQESAAAAQLRQGIESDCERLESVVRRRAPADAPARVSEANVLAARGILAFHTGRYEAAWEALQDEVRRDARMEEVWEMLGEVGAALAGRASERDEKERWWRESEKAYTEGLARDRGYLAHLVGRGDTRAHRGRYRGGRGQDPLADWAGAEEDYNAALRLNAKSVDALIRRGTVRNDCALYLKNRGEDPLAHWEGADRDFSDALALDSTCVYAFTSRGMVRQNRGEHRMGRGQDPLADWAAAEEDLSRALQVKADSTYALATRGLLRNNRGIYRRDHGGDPLPDWRAAEGDYTQALRLDKDDVNAWIGRCRTRANRAVHRVNVGDDPTSDWRSAEEDLTEALRLDAGSVEARAQRGHVRGNRAVYLLRRGEDPMADLRGAEDDFSEALRLNKEFLDAWVTRAGVRNTRAAYVMRRGGDPLPDYAAAENDASMAIELKKDSYETWATRGLVRNNRAFYLRSRGQDPLPDYAAAEGDLSEALRLNSQSAETCRDRGALRFTRAGSRERAGDRAGARQDFAAAAADFAEAIRIRPSLEAEAGPRMREAQRRVAELEK